MISGTSFNYNGKNQTPTVSVKYNGQALTKDKDYTVTYPNTSINAGSYEISITGLVKYTGTVKKTFTIAQLNQQITAANKKATYKKSGTLNLGAKRTAGDGKLTYKSSNTKVCTVNSSGKITFKGCGKATITITAAATTNYKAATKKITVTIVPQRATVSKLTSPSTKKVKATWKKDTTATAYEVQTAKNTKFTSGKKAKVITKNGTTNYTFTKLSKGKTYYVRVRAYKTIDGKKQYGAWSTLKKIKCK